MHGEAGFQKTRALLVDRGFAEDDVQAYTGEAFGSWLVTLRTSPRLRIIWDGKDEWAIIAAELSSLPRPRGCSAGRTLKCASARECPSSVDRTAQLLRALPTRRRDRRRPNGVLEPAPSAAPAIDPINALSPR